MVLEIDTCDCFGIPNKIVHGYVVHTHTHTHTRIQSGRKDPTYIVVVIVALCGYYSIWFLIPIVFAFVSFNTIIISYVKQQMYSPTAPKKQPVAEVRTHITFRNLGTDPAFEDAILYYDHIHIVASIGHGDEDVSLFSHEGHVWTIKDEDTILKEFTIGTEPTYLFEF